MGKPASLAECQKQERHLSRLQEKRIKHAEETRELNKAIATATTKLQCMLSGKDEPEPELFDGKGKAGDDDEGE